MKNYNIQFIDYQEKLLHAIYSDKIPQKGEGLVFQTGTRAEPKPIFYRVQDVVHGYHTNDQQRWVESGDIWITVKRVSSFGMENQVPEPA